MAKKRKLTDKQKLFVEYYLQSWNATQASRKAGYKGNYTTLQSVGSENLRKPLIREEIQKRISETIMDANEVLSRLGSMARGFDIANYIEQVPIYESNKKDGKYLAGYAMKVDFEALKTDGYSHLIKRVSSTKRGTMIIEWHDQMQALVHIGKHFKLFTDRREVSGPDGGPIEIDDKTLTDEERARRVAAILDRGRDRRDRPSDK